MHRCIAGGYVLDAFFEHFSPTPYLTPPSPPPHTPNPQEWGQGSGSILFRGWGGGGRVGGRYVVWGWGVFFGSLEDVWGYRTWDGLSTHALQTRLVPLCWAVARLTKRSWEIFWSILQHQSKNIGITSANLRRTGANQPCRLLFSQTLFM